MVGSAPGPLSAYAVKVSLTTRTTALVAMAIALVAALALPATLGVSSARAHADLVSTDPVDGAELTAEPTQIVFTFSESLLPDFVRFLRISDTGETNDLPVTSVDNNVATVGWPADLGPGVWTVEYRVVSQDGHPVNGSISFNVAATPTPSPTPTPTPSPTTTPTPAPSPTADPTTAPAPEPSPTTSPAADTTGSTTGWLIAGIAVIALAVVVIVGLVVRRR